MCRTLVLVAVALALSSPASMAEASQAKPAQASQAKPAQRPATKKPAPAKPAPAAAPAPKPEPPPPPPPPPGVKMTTAYTQGAQVSTNTTYLQGARQRVEFPGVVTLDQCDLKRSLLLNTAVKRYRVQPYPEPKPAAAPAAAPDPMAAQLAQMQLMQQGPGQKPRGGVVTMTTTLSDTLERQTMFGLEARRIKTIVIKQSSPTACDKSPLKIEMDAWYVDLPEQSACARPTEAAGPPPVVDPAACVDIFDTRVVGDVKLGFPVKLTTTTITGEGNKIESSTSTQEVTALEITQLERALFEVPADFVEATSTAEIVPTVATGASLSEALFGSTADGTSMAAPKKPGTVRIGILQPVNKTARDLPGAASLRQELVAKFNKAPYEAVPLAGSSASAVEQDAVRLQCDFVMLAEVIEAKTSKPGKMGGVMKMTGSVPKDSHDVKIDYKLYAVGATQAPKASGNVKASNGGFGIGSALRLAAFAGQMYMGMMMGGGMGMGMGMGMMNPMMAMSGMSGMGGMGMSGALFDPRASAMTSMMSSFGAMGGLGGMSGVADPSDAGMRDTLSEAMTNSAKAAMEQLGKKK